MKITAWKCKKTGKVYESREKFAKHLLRLRKTATREFTYRQLVKHAPGVFEEMVQTCTTADEIAQYLHDNWPTFIAYGIDQYPYKVDLHDAFVINFPTLLDLKFVSDLELYHHYSIGQVYRARIKYKYRGDYSGRLFDGTPLVTGSGGLGGWWGNIDNNRTYEYEVYFPLDKWPALSKQYMYEKLNGTL
jgi:hypothetical protein